MAVRVAVCHASPHFLSASHSTQKAISLINRAAIQAPNLIVFPESYIPAFPVWSAIIPPSSNHHLFQRMAESSVLIDGPEVAALRAAAKSKAVTISIGISEKVKYSAATLFNTNLIIDGDGEIQVHHRKLMPTFFEKLTWSPGDGYGLRVTDLLNHRAKDNKVIGKLGALICGENTNPLARYSLMAQGENIHISSWPAIWPTRAPSLDSTTVGNDSATQSTKNYDNVAANRTRAAAHCFEAKAFGILCAGYLSPEMIEYIVQGSNSPQHIRHVLETSSRGASMFLDPTGALKKGWIIDEKSGARKEVDMLQFEEDILYADLDITECVEGKQYHDVVGGYQRLDVFDLKVDRRRREPVTLVEGVRN